MKKDIKYLNRDFGQFRSSLIDFAKTYFPNTYTDFNETDPGMMFIEMAASVGDVLSLYTDASLRENLINYSVDKRNIFDLSYMFGYKPKNVIPSIVELDVYQLLPSIGSGSNTVPDWNYALSLNSNSTVKSKSNYDTTFRTLETVNFRQSSSYSPTEVKVYEYNNITNEPTYYLIKKQVKAISGTIRTRTFTFDSPKEYDKITLEDEGIIEIVDVYDSDGDRWWEVPYLAQDTIFESVENNNINDNTLHQYNTTVPYLMKLRQVPKRFVTRFKTNGVLDIQFGSGISSQDDEELIPNPDLVGSSLLGTNRTYDFGIDPSNFLYTKTYGIAPHNTTLTIRYTVGNGISDNIPSNDLVEPGNLDITQSDGLDESLANFIQRSIKFNNPSPSSGGKDQEDDNDVRLNAMANFASQNRAVTKEDYIVRCYSLPPKFGSIAKAYITPDDQIDYNSHNEYINNPYGMNLYVLGYDQNKQLTIVNEAIKENLKTYLSQYRILTDSINIKDAFIINIGVEFDIITRPNYNGNEVLVRCIDKLKSIFNISKWQINQPIRLNNLYTELDKVEGVQTVVDVRVFNKFKEADGYSGNIYDIMEATKDGIIYPSLDPSIFEIKYLNKDILGKVVNR